MSAQSSDYTACREAIRHGSRSFFAASKLLPRSMRDPAYALYAFCRLSDDAVDLPGASADAVDQLRLRLDLIYAGTPHDAPADRALSDVVRRFDMPRALLEALLEGLEWDRDGRLYETIEDLHAYSARVAGAVGAMMAVLMGSRSEWMLARACDLGVAMQLTNIARDVGEDARAGRLYVPRQWMRETGLDPDVFLADPVASEKTALLVKRLLAEADRLYRRSQPGIACLPLACRPAIWAARYIYADIGTAIAALDHNSIDHRARTGTGRKLALLGLSVGAATVPMGADRTPALDEVRFLVDAAVLPEEARRPLWKLDDGIVRVFEMLADVQERERAHPRIQIGE